jgi:hemerythrin
MSLDKATWHEVHPLILRTREFMEFHFSVEESLMRLLPYPDCDAHRAEHRLELKHIADIERGVLSGAIRDSLAARMRDCLFGHIIAGDKRFAQYALGIFAERSPGNRKGRGGAAAARGE